MAYGSAADAERGFGRDRCRLEVADRRAARGSSRAASCAACMPSAIVLARAQLRLADHELGAHHEEAARHARERHVQRPIARRARRLLLDRRSTTRARRGAGLFRIGELATCRHRVQVRDALDDARHEARGRVVRRRVAHGERPDHPWWPLDSCSARAGMLTACTVVLDASDDERTSPVCVRIGPPVAAAPRHDLGHALRRRDHQLERASALLTALRVEMSTAARCARCLNPGGAWPVSVCDRRLVGQRLALRDHQLEDGGVLGAERGGPVVEDAPRDLHDARARRPLALEAERLLVAAGLRIASALQRIRLLASSSSCCDAETLARLLLARDSPGPCARGASPRRARSW